ncbi:MAG: hypothetical protein AB4058_20755 [Microcystaceae cyanobacterium]
MNQQTTSLSNTTQAQTSTIDQSLNINYDPLIHDSDWRWWFHGDASPLVTPVSQPSCNHSAKGKFVLASFLSFIFLTIGLHSFLIEEPLGNKRLPTSETQISLLTGE